MVEEEGTVSGAITVLVACTHGGRGGYSERCDNCAGSLHAWWKRRGGKMGTQPELRLKGNPKSTGSLIIAV